MRVLMLSTPSPSHFTPMLPMAWALLSAGHQVLVAGQPDVLEAARSGGLNATKVGEVFDGDGMLSQGLGEGQRPIQARPRPPLADLGGYGRVWWANAEKVLDEVLEFARGFRPDLVLADQMEYTSLFVAGALGVPAVHHRWGVDALSGPARAYVRDAVRAKGEELGIDVPEGPAAMLDPCPPSLQWPTAEPGLQVRYVPSNGNGELPDWLRHGRDTRLRLRRVAVSFSGSTLALNGVPFVRRMLAAFEDVPRTEAVATVGAAFRPQLGEVPYNVRMVDPVPLHLMLGTCDAMVHHGGAGTTLTATAFGLPQLALPQLADHFVHGDRIAEEGLGLSVDTAAEQDDPARLRDALNELLSTPSFAGRARELAREREAAPPPSHVVADLEKLAR